MTKRLIVFGTFLCSGAVCVYADFPCADGLVVADLGNEIWPQSSRSTIPDERGTSDASGKFSAKLSRWFEVSTAVCRLHLRYEQQGPDGFSECEAAGRRLAKLGCTKSLIRALKVRSVQGLYGASVGIEALSDENLKHNRIALVREVTDRLKNGFYAEFQNASEEGTILSLAEGRLIRVIQRVIGEPVTPSPWDASDRKHDVVKKAELWLNANRA